MTMLVMATGTTFVEEQLVEMAHGIAKLTKMVEEKDIVDPAFSAQCVSHSMASSIFIWKIDFYWLFENDLESPLIFVLFLKGKQNKKKKP